MTPHINTDRLLLRPIELADATSLYALINNVDVAKWLTPVPWPYTERDAETFVSRVCAQSDDAYYAITRDDIFMGCISYGAQLGYWLGEPFWGQGFMSEAAQAVLEDYFNDGHEELISGYHLGNVTSCKVLEKMGFTNTECVQSASNVSGDVTIQRMILTHATWAARQS